MSAHLLTRDYIEDLDPEQRAVLTEALKSVMIRPAPIRRIAGTIYRAALDARPTPDLSAPSRRLLKATDARGLLFSSIGQRSANAAGAAAAALRLLNHPSVPAWIPASAQPAALAMTESGAVQQGIAALRSRLAMTGEQDGRMQVRVLLNEVSAPCLDLDAADSGEVDYLATALAGHIDGAVRGEQVMLWRMDGLARERSAKGDRWLVTIRDGEATARRA